MNKLDSLKERIKKNFKENKVLLFAFIVIWIVMIVFTYNYYSNTFGKESYGPSDLSDVIEIDKNINISQILSVDGDTQTLSLKFATYARKNKGNITIKVIGNDSNHIYLDKTLDVRKVEDNAYATYSFDKKLENKNDSQIEIQVYSNSENGEAIGLYFSTVPYFETSDLTINNELSSKELGVKFLLENNNLNTFSKIAIYYTVIVLSITLLILLLINPKKEVMFTLLACVFGLTLMLVISPGGAPDELLHYEQTLQVSNIMMFEDPDSIDKAYLNYDSYADHVNTSNSYNRFIRDFNKPLKLKNEKEGFTFELGNNYVGYYVPQAIGITIARLIKVNSLKAFYAGRLTNLIFYLVCVYIAIKNTPTNKMLLGVIANIPIFVQQASSYSYDAFINGLILLLISFFFKWYFIEEKISKKDFIFVFVVCMLLAPAKVIYGIFILLFWFIPVDRFYSKKHKALSILILCSPTIALIGYNAYIRTIGMLKDGIYDKTANLVMADPTQAVVYVGDDDWQLFNIHFILKHPIYTIQMLYRSVRFYLSTWFYQALGRSLAGSNLVIPMIIIRIVMVCIGISAFRQEEYVLPISIKVLFILACLAIALLILIMMLTGWTERGDVLIKGVQGRYFCPLLPYFFSVLTNRKFKLPKKLDIYVLFTLIIINFETIMYVLTYTFVN